MERVFEIEREAISPPWSYEALLEELKREDSFFIVALDDAAPLAYAVLRRVGDDGELLRIATRKDSRRGGVGDLLMSAVLEYARENAFNSIFLEVRSGNTAAIGLYEKHGFSPVRVREEYYDNPIEDAVVMAKGAVS